MQGIVFDIKRYAVHDGPGIRTTVFLKGCPLGCWWCHNPESQNASVETVCRNNRMGDVEVNQETALGEVMTVNQLIREIGKDVLFFDESDGGVTFSGGEPMMQGEFLDAMLTACREEDIHTAVDTTGLATPVYLQKIMDKVDLFLFDLKQMDDELHRKYTGVSNKQILENLKLLADNGKRVIVRYPMIPGINDSEENINQMIDCITQLGIKEVDILPYHRIGKDKYDRFQIENRMPDTPDLKPEETVWVKERMEAVGLKVEIGG
ncbi:MAG: glycyl-radical enzyme activating protein [Marinifilaceae bacterium]